MTDFSDRLKNLSPEKRRSALDTLPGDLVNTAQTARLHQLLTDFDFIQAKLAEFGVQALIEDYNLAIKSDVLLNLEQRETLELIAGALRRSAHVLEEDTTQLAGQLWGRLLSFDRPEIVALLEQAKQKQEKPWFRPLAANLTPPGGPLIRTLTGHSDSVNAVAITPDGKQAVSGSDDTTLKLWDLATGSELATLRGHSSSVLAVAITPSGKQALSASLDETLKLWDLLTGRIVATFGGEVGFKSCAMKPDGVTVVAGDTSGGVHFLRLEMDAPLASPCEGSENPLSLLSEGLSLVQQGREEEAMSCWEKAVKLRPDAASMIWGNGGKALYKQGKALWEAENYEGAVRCFQGAVKVQPDNAEYWNYLAASQYNSGDAEAALSSYETALKLQPDDANIWDNRGYAFHILGRYEEAIASYQKALELDSNYANAYYNIACLYGLQGDVDLAVQNLQRAISLDSRYRKMAKTDQDFERIRGDSRFRALLGE